VIAPREIVRRVEALFALANSIDARFVQARQQIEKVAPAVLDRALRSQLVPPASRQAGAPIGKALTSHLCFIRSFLAVWVVFMAAGCAHRLGPEPSVAQRQVSVSFPRLEFANEEYVQSIEVEIRCGRVVSINRLLDDWDLELAWDHPGRLMLEMHARHFSSGLADLSVLDDFITVESDEVSAFTITAHVRTASTDPTGRGERTNAVSHANFMFKAVSPPNRNCSDRQ
jgi:hypothetical protein